MSPAITPGETHFGTSWADAAGLRDPGLRVPGSLLASQGHGKVVLAVHGRSQGPGPVVVRDNAGRQ